MSHVLGTEVPTAAIRIRGESLRYMDQPSRSDSYGVSSAPDWLYPTALTFGTKVMHAEKLGTVAEIGNGPMPPEELLGRMEMAVRGSVRNIARMLKRGELVVEFDGMQSEISVGPFHGAAVRTRAVVWPAVSGVTTRYEDGTL